MSGTIHLDAESLRQLNTTILANRVAEERRVAWQAAAAIKKASRVANKALHAERDGAQKQRRRAAWGLVKAVGINPSSVRLRNGRARPGDVRKFEVVYHDYDEIWRILSIAVDPDGNATISNDSRAKVAAKLGREPWRATQ
jgi:mannose-6-phosphate isomerase-like protein (cupin superfamily)